MTARGARRGVGCRRTWSSRIALVGVATTLLGLIAVLGPLTPTASAEEFCDTAGANPLYHWVWVCDSDTVPIAGARIDIYPADAPDQLVHTWHTGPGGYVEEVDPLPVADYLLIASADGHEPTSMHIDSFYSDPMVAEIELPSLGPALSVMIVDPERGPIADTVVTATSDDHALESTTDAGGSAGFGRVPVGSYDLHAAPHGYETVEGLAEAPLGGADVTVELTAAASPVPLTVVVSDDDGTPITGAVVTAVRDPASSPRSEHHAISDPDGVADLGALAPGDYVVTVQADGHQHDSTSVEVPLGAEAVTAGVALAALPTDTDDPDPPVPPVDPPPGDPPPDEPPSDDPPPDGEPPVDSPPAGEPGPGGEPAPPVDGSDPPAADGSDPPADVAPDNDPAPAPPPAAQPEPPSGGASPSGSSGTGDTADTPIPAADGGGASGEPAAGPEHGDEGEDSTPTVPDREVAERPDTDATPAGEPGPGDEAARGIAADQASSFGSSLPTIGSMPIRADRAAANSLIAVAAAFLLILPAELFNATLRENYDRVLAPFAAIRKASRKVAAAVAAPRPVTVAAFAVAAAVASSALDPGFGAGLGSLRMVLAQTLALSVTVFVACGVSLALARRFGVPGSIHLRPAGLLVCFAVVVISRAVGVAPGFLYGLVVGVQFHAAIDLGRLGRIALTQSAFLVAVAVTSWTALGIVHGLAPPPETGFFAGLSAEVLTALTVGPLTALVITLVPLTYLRGEMLITWSRRAWVATYAVVLFAFLSIAVNPVYGSRPATASLAVWISAYLIFGLGSVLFWLRYRNTDDRSRADRLTEVAPRA